jgi:hypothetical protein
MEADRQLGADKILAELRHHPRVAYQSLVSHPNQLEQLRTTLPALVPFGDAHFYGVIPVVDWDHRLPSRSAVLRIFAYYTETTMRAGTAEFEGRKQQITAQDRFPEFDVPDYAGISADEAYEADLDTNAAVVKIRLVSGWRRDIEEQTAHDAVQIARRSDQFKKLAQETRGQRPDYLGDLEAVSWTPPCESGLADWSIDVWYLMYLDASVGKGRSFLVDMGRQAVVGVREFVVRSS